MNIKGGFGLLFYSNNVIKKVACLSHLVLRKADFISVNLRAD